jgi:ubiquinone biosynthesis protein COQ9
MDDDAFDKALIRAAFTLAADSGWRGVNVAAAAQAGDLPLPRARARFPGRHTLLMRFGRMADQAALSDVPTEGPVRDRLFEMIMRRLDTFQAHRAGVITLLRALPLEPPTAVLLACATKRSMRWLLQAAGVSTGGVRGELKVRGLVGVWLWTLRAWERDESTDLSATMAALDTALRRAGQVAEFLHGGRKGQAAPEEPIVTEGPLEKPDPSAGTA